MALSLQHDKENFGKFQESNDKTLNYKVSAVEVIRLCLSLLLMKV